MDVGTRRHYRECQHTSKKLLCFLYWVEKNTHECSWISNKIVYKTFAMDEEMELASD